VKRRPHNEQLRRRASASATAYWSDPELRAAHREKTRRRMDRPDVRVTISDRTKIAMADPDVSARQRAGLKRAFADPGLRQKISEQTKAGIEAKLERHFADLIKLWEAMPKKCVSGFWITLPYLNSAPGEHNERQDRGLTHQDVATACNRCLRDSSTTSGRRLLLAHGECQHQ
jgi:hypothetical protein